MSYQISKEYNNNLKLKRYDLGGVGVRKGQDNWYVVNVSTNSDIVSDARTLDDVISKNSVAEFYLSHIFEHFYHDEQIELLKYWITFLCIGGCIRIKLTDMGFLAQEYVQGKIPWIVLASCGWVPASRNKNHSPHMHHYWGFDKNYLAEIMLAAGLIDVEEEPVRGWKLDFDETQSTGLNNNYTIKNLQIVGFKGQ